MAVKQVRRSGPPPLTLLPPDESIVRSRPGKAQRATGPRRRAAMVEWFSPSVLLGTGVNQAISTQFGRRADPRELDASTAEDAVGFDYARTASGAPVDEMWLDFVADVGDGWNPTFAVASALAARVARVSWKEDTGERASALTARGRLVVFGGDLVYPVASRKQYQERLVLPYESAFESEPPHPDAFAIPGNHDWYDSLVAFRRRFCSGDRRWLGGWRTRQTRSYFALRLPHDWWLLGTDVQLDADIDRAQKRYFEQVAAAMGPRDRVILCTPEPHWIDEALARPDAGVTQDNLHCLEEILGGRVRVFLAGDLHHYRRHSRSDTVRGAPIERHKITSGGGGAFLHPTHNGARKLARLPDRTGHYDHKTSYPSVWRSRLLGLRLLWAFPLQNPSFGLVTAILYLVTWGTLGVDNLASSVSSYSLAWRHIGDVWRLESVAFVRSQSACVWALLLCAGTVAFIRSDRPWYRVSAGILHAFAHIAAAGLVGWVATRVVLSLGAGDLLSGAAMVALILLGGYAVGAMLVGAYLCVSIVVFGRHSNDAFAALAIQDYKNFVRLHVQADGRLRIYPMKLARVERERRWWGGGSRLGPPVDGPHAPELVELELIEKWFDVT